MRIVAVALLAFSFATACEESYDRCRPERAPADFPIAGDTAARCTAVCDHFASIGCRLGCPLLPDGGSLDASAVETSFIDCYDACAAASLASSVSTTAIDRVLLCYAGTESCLQAGACTRFCGDDGGPVWSERVICTDFGLADAGD